MKHFSASIQQSEQQYRALRRSARQRTGPRARGFWLLVLLCKFLTDFLFLPALQQLWALTLRFSPMNYLNNQTASQIFSSPSILGGIVLLAVLAAFWSLYEIVFLLCAFARIRQDRPLQPLGLLWEALCTAGRVFLPQNLPLLLYGAAMIPVTNFFLAANHLTQFAVPEYLLGLLRARPANPPLFALAVLAVLVLLLSSILILPRFVWEHKSFAQAAAESLRDVRGQTGPICWAVLRWMGTAILQAGLLALGGAALLYGVILAIGLASTSAMLALSRAALLIEVPSFCFLIDCSLTAAQAGLMDALYCAHQELPAPQPGQPARRVLPLLAALSAGVTLFTCGVAGIYLLFPREEPLQSVLGSAEPVITYHRGYSSIAPENTLPAFQAALDHGSPRIELDVQMTRDGVAMVTHDTSLRRCTGRIANIYDLTYEEVRRLDAGRWFSRKYAGARVPTLEEVLALCQGKTELNIEIKPSAATPDLEQETVRLIYQYGFEHDCVVTSQSYETLCKVKALAPEITTGYILALGVGTYYDLPAADFFSVESSFITSGMVQQIHLRGKTISAWTINRQQDAEALLKLGVDDLITDKPEIIEALLVRDKELDNRLLWLRDQLQSLFAAPDADEAQEIEEAIEDPEELLDEA